ncbi:hypothetical protein [Streptosporangium sp. NPDC001681]|uniref:hypothetical protein n=1 Tax=Streptosporangium sp. NPDC001681 TaxID=3154395 RepID=UPI0033251158
MTMMPEGCRPADGATRPVLVAAPAPVRTPGPGSTWGLEDLDHAAADKDRAAAPTAIRGNVLAVATGPAALLAVFYTARNADTARCTFQLGERGHDTDRFSKAVEHLGLTYLAADSVVYNLGYADLSLTTTNRVRWAGEQAGGPYHEAVYTYLQVRGLWASTSWNDALTVLDSARASIEDEYVEGQPEALAVWGGLQLCAAITAARKNDAAEAWSRHRLAGEAVTRLGPRQRTNYYELCTSQTNVDIHGVAVAVELGDGPQAVSRGKTVRLPKGLQANRVGCHHLDYARGLLWCGHREAATAELEHAERAAPLLIRDHPMARQAVRTLLDLERYNYRERIRRLGVRMHIL